MVHGRGPFGEAGARPRTGSIIEFWNVLHEVGAGGDLLDRLGRASAMQG